MKPLYEIHGLKCDFCDYKDDSIKYEDYPNWINKPCPICGHSLLTQEDYDATRSIVHIVDRIEKVLGPKLTRLLAGKKRTRVNFHGKGWKDADIEEK